MFTVFYIRHLAFTSEGSDHEILASRFSLLTVALVAAFAAAEQAHANCALSSGPAHNTGEYWFDGEQTAHLINSWYDSELSPIPDPDEDFEAPIESGGPGGGGHPQGSNGTHAKPQTGDLAAQCMRVPTLRNTPITAYRIPKSAPGIIVIAVRTMHPGPIHVMRARVPKTHKLPYDTNCGVDRESRQGEAARAHHIIAGAAGLRTRPGDTLELTYTDGKVESWFVVDRSGMGFLSISPFNTQGERMPSQCPN